MSTPNDIHRSHGHVVAVLPLPRYAADVFSSHSKGGSTEHLVVCNGSYAFVGRFALKMQARLNCKKIGFVKPVKNKKNSSPDFPTNCEHVVFNLILWFCSQLSEGVHEFAYRYLSYYRSR
jgi:hypothetical protein